MSTATNKNSPLKKGFKQSEVGVIPEDWEVKKLNNVVHRVEYGSSSKSQKTGKIPVLRMGNLQGGKIDYGNLVYSNDDFEISKYMLNKNDVLFNRTNTPELVGKTSIYKGEMPAIFAGYLIRIHIKKDELDPTFLNYWLNTYTAQKYSQLVLSIAVGQANINGVKLKSYPIPLPPTLAEQTAIATALSDVDALIDSLDRLIAKKQNIKQGAMQELLTGKKRLAGFEGEWVERKLGDVGSTFGGLTGKSKADFGSGEGLYVTFMNVMSNVVIDKNTFEKVNIKPSETQNRVKKGDLLFNGSSETPEEVAFCSLVKDDVENLYLNSFCFGFRLFNETDVDGLFLSYYLRSTEGREIIKSLAQGSTRYNLSKIALLNSYFVLPKKEEQTAIATILSDMGKELTALSSRRSKTVALKQSMMQELLTGKTRLV
jgi:type I restriction enzyme S subunit